MVASWKGPAAKVALLAFRAPHGSVASPTLQGLQRPSARNGELEAWALYAGAKARATVAPALWAVAIGGKGA